MAKEKVSEAHESSSGRSASAVATTGEAFSKIRQLPRALTELLSNPAFFMLNLAGASEGLLIAGFAAFLPKLIENQFSVNASSAALLMGEEILAPVNYQPFTRRFSIWKCHPLELTAPSVYSTTNLYPE